MSDKLPVNFPDDLTLSSDQDLQDLETAAQGEFDSLEEQDDVTPETIERMNALADGLDRIRSAKAGREAAASAAADRERQKYLTEKERLSTRVKGPKEVTQELEVTPAVDAEAITAAVVKGMSEGLAPLFTDSKVAKRAGGSLAEARRYAPQPKGPKPSLAVTAGVEIPGYSRGDDLNNLENLADAFHKKAKIVPLTQNPEVGGQTVAQIRNEYEHTVDNRTSPAQVSELLQFLTTKDKQEALVAGGGWCAPSEVRYDFFNIACEDGTIDLPTFGVTRGGIRFPVSPSLADAGLALSGITNATQPWLWTEADDQATVTGSPNKPCIRVPCPTFDERRLECYGVCLTAGNLTDDAYPEATQNFLRLLMSAHAHAMNARIISTMETLSAAIVTGGAFDDGGPAFPAVLNGVALAATDYRTRFGMCEDDVLEVVLPSWLLGAMQADLLRRTGVDPDDLNLTRQMANSFFASRNVRAQWVGDWQVRGTGQFGAAAVVTAWPGTVDFMIYAAGTFVLGNGLTLDLGVVRDSVLNAENDHTAAWSEECHLVARVGHESRRFRVALGIDGDTCCTTVTGGL